MKINFKLSKNGKINSNFIEENDKYIGISKSSKEVIQLLKEHSLLTTPENICCNKCNSDVS